MLEIWRTAGIDPTEGFKELMKERDKIQAAIRARGGRRGAIRGFVIPTLRSIGLFSERIEGHFEEMFRANLGVLRGSLADDPQELPADLESWALGEA